ncbi:hydrogenase/urease maturation nickel metallochaperone HypA [Saccharolobus islandicus]|uniref:Hydrogenase expression/synthesis HypA n=1 Tax=Saccharolobus islandicus (strain HVE10/4) TaxID=930943 RepID=F0NJW7_SACI0|nr:hydrogenase/urease maturation nickel metallochaperone HypA [Sulfolobus islandicus]ADX82283.1 hydrogenase expression/synthesis HypA [Sulfolobus islandicus HVE10/4]WCM36402.1 hydrogenase maturation nickel metallochaperone HypA [Sulfolobus islandicus]
MHEWSIAYSIVKTLTNNFTKKVLKATLVIPQFSFLDLEILKDAFNELKKENEITQNTELEIRIAEPRFRCRSCNREFSMSDVEKQLSDVRSEYGEEYPLHLMPELFPVFLKCPYCGSHDIEAKGQEIYIENVVEKSGAVARTS